MPSRSCRAGGSRWPTSSPEPVPFDPALPRCRSGRHHRKDSPMSAQCPEAKSLPARYYTDPDYYRAELEWFFFGMWFHAGRADQIPNRGDFVVREIAGESVILVRGERGEIGAFYNVCRHRGTRLSERR